MQTFLLFVHVLGAATWFGSSFAATVMSARYRTVDGPAASTFHRAIADLGMRAQTPAAVVLLITGIFLVLGSNGAYAFESVFVVIGFLTIVVGAVLGSRFFGPLSTRSAELHEAGKAGEAGVLQTRLGKIAMFDLALLAFTIAAMVWRWGA
jgi:hypothetical protein